MALDINDLPPVGTDEWQSYQADKFGRDADSRIGALGFNAAASERISSLSSLVAPDRQRGAQQPQEAGPPTEQPQEAPPSPRVGYEPTAPLAAAPAAAPPPPSSVAPPPAPPSSLATPPAGSGGRRDPNLVALALNAADQEGVDPALFASLVDQESSFNPNARSPVGARGLSQLMPETARGLGVNPDDPQDNLRGGARYLKQNLDKFDGDVVKALAAYNAGPGAVQKYGGVPPFEETQRYVDTIMTRVAQSQQAGDLVAPDRARTGPDLTGPTDLLAPDRRRQIASTDISQFGDPQLTSDEAYAACGPAAAVRFAERFGRNPTLREATDLAKQVGWTPQQGMAGLQSEKQLMDKLGVPTKLVSGADWQTFAKEAQTGNPVTISTQGHYFFADGYNPDTGAFHVGRSGLDLRRGKEWMTPQEMTAVMGPVQGGLLADNPTVPTPSQAEAETDPNTYLDKHRQLLSQSFGEDQPPSLAQTTFGQDRREARQDAVATQPASSLTPEPQQTMWDRLGQGIGEVFKNVFGGATSEGGAGPQSATGAPYVQPGLRTPEETATAREQAAMPAISTEPSAASSLAGAGLPSATGEPYQQTAPPPQERIPGVGEAISDVVRGPMLRTDEELLSKATPRERELARQLAALTTPNPTDQDIADVLRSQQLGYAYAGTHTGPGGAPQNQPSPFHLHTEPAPGRVPLTPEDTALHVEDLASRYQSNDARIIELENRLEGGTFTKGRGGATGDVVRPPWAAGWTTEAVRDLAQRNGLNPYRDGWWETGNFLPGTGEMRYDVGQSGLKGTGTAQQTATEARRELERLRGEQEQILSAADHIDSLSGEATFYRPEPVSTDMPWAYDVPAGANAGEVGPAARQAQDLTGADTGGSRGYPPTSPAGVGTSPPLGTAEVTASRPALLPGTPRPSALPTARQRVLGPGPIQLTRAQEIERLRLQDFPEDVRQTIVDHAEQIDFARTQRRGVISDDLAQQMAEQYAADHTLDQVIRQGVAGKAYNTEQIRALRNATAAQAVKVSDLAEAIRAGDDSSTALRDFWTEGQRLQRIVQIAEGAKAESGRALRAYQDPARLLELSPNDAVAQITKRLGDRSKLLDVVQQYQALTESGAGPTKLANFWASLGDPVGITDWVKLIRYNSMLSGPRSFEVNAIGNSLELPWRLARDTGASLIRGRPGEIAVEANGMWAGLETANRAFMETLTQGITQEAALRGEIPRSLSARLSTSTSPLARVGRPVATALEAPGRLMGAADQWAQAIAYSMAFGREAAVQASREGLRGDAWTARVSQQLAEPRIAPKLMQKADDIAERMTYHGDMGAFGEGLQSLTQKTGVFGNLILPFLRTVYHISARGIDRSPVGIIGTGIDVARGAYGPRTRAGLGEALAGGGPRPKGVAPLGERLGDNLMGSGVFLAIYSQAVQGNVSAAGPDDSDRRALLRSEGWQPYSIRLGDRWISYANWGPAAIPFALAGAASESQRYAKGGADVPTMMLDGMRRTAQIVQEQTYLQSIGAAWKGMTDPKAYGPQFVNGVVSSLVPFGSAINTLGQATDEVARRPEKFDVGAAIRARLPEGTPLIGGRETVPEAQDVLGRPAPNTRSGLGALNPLLVSSDRADPVLRVLDQAGVTVPAAPDHVTRNSVPIELKPEEQREVQRRAGAKIADRVATEINSQSYAALTPEGKTHRLSSIVDKARQSAEKEVLDAVPLEEYQRRREKGRAKKEPVPVSGR